MLANRVNAGPSMVAMQLLLQSSIGVLQTTAALAGCGDRPRCGIPLAFLPPFEHDPTTDINFNISHMPQCAVWDDMLRDAPVFVSRNNSNTGQCGFPGQSSSCCAGRAHRLRSEGHLSTYEECNENLKVIQTWFNSESGMKKKLSTQYVLASHV
jgi:hypothetical protein